MRPWFVYTLHDPREPDVPRYVGWTIDVARRAKEHTSAKKVRETRCSTWRLGLISAGVYPVMTVIESGVGDKLGMVAEAKWIAHYRALVGDRLTNLTDGGEGVCGYRFTEAVRAKMSASHRGKKLSPGVKAMLMAHCVGRTVSAETKAKLSAKKKGRKPLPEHVKKAADARRGMKVSDEAKKNVSAGLRRFHARRKAMATKPTKLESVAALKRAGVNDRGAIAREVYGQDTKKLRNRVSALLTRLGLSRLRKDSRAKRSVG